MKRPKDAAPTSAASRTVVARKNHCCAISELRSAALYSAGRSLSVRITARYSSDCFDYRINIPVVYGPFQRC